MKLVVLAIFGFLAVSTNAAGGFALDQSSNIDAEANVEGSSQQVTEDAGPEDISTATSDADTPMPDVKPTSKGKDLATATITQTTLQKDAPEPTTGTGNSVNSSGKTSIMDTIPFPMNVILRTFGKDAVKAFDVESMCDTVQLIDWRQYQKLLENEDFAGFKEKIANDEMLSAFVDAFHLTMNSYINKMMTAFSKNVQIDGLDSFQNILKEFQGLISLEVAQKDNGAEMKKNLADFFGRITTDKKAQKEALENMQKNIEKFLGVMAKAKVQNSIDVSSKNELSGYNKGSPVA